MSIRCVYTVSPDTVYLGTYDALYRSISGGLYWERFDLRAFSVSMILISTMPIMVWWQGIADT
ncbi:MAG: hypothetical protein IPP46_00370 [Bacteroidetes bacterium]|nr:hypothetical protein [Bacteroidota bacterium]